MLATILAVVALICAAASFFVARKIEVLAIGVACLAIIHLLGVL
jgi:hypothetical protein